MGVVFAARQRRLDRKVAVKILRPELATATAAERFLAEGRLLARLAHPHIVPVYDAGEADGLLYYVMEFVEGETLAERLSRGPLPAAQAVALARDLLSALAAAHALGVVHRDIKPANLFLRGGRVLLGDFGIARVREEQGGQGFTTPGELVGTPRYMAPEQRDGGTATTRTDVYAVGLVLYETCTGARWPSYQEPGGGDWARVPAQLAAPLRRALELDPAKRWEDAAAFLAELHRRPVVLRRAAMITLPLVAALVAWVVWPRSPPPEPRRGFAVDVGAVVEGATSPAARALGDSVAAEIRQLLAFPDFDVRAPGQRGGVAPAIQLRVRVHDSGGRLSVLAREEAASDAPGDRIGASRAGPHSSWRALAEQVADDLALPIYQRAEHDPYFPKQAAPRNPADQARFVKAEQYFAQGRWQAARTTYPALDSTCLLCVLRSVDITRWFGLPKDSAALALLARSEASFPDHYRLLIHAILSPFPARLDALEQVEERYAGFYLASFELADELFHRGPLNGRLRRAALAPLSAVLLNRPGFAPAREHLAWLLMSEGDSASARVALDSLLGQPVESGFDAALPALRLLGYHWRYLPADSARRFSTRLLQDPEIVAYPGAVAGARLLMTMDAPRGAVELGRMFVEWKARPDAALSGLLAQLFGYAALGQLDSVRVVGERFAQRDPDPSYHVLALELEALLRSFDPDSTGVGSADVALELQRVGTLLRAGSALSRRIAWATGLLAARAGDPAGVAAARTALREESPPGTLTAILNAAAIGRDNPARALELVPTIPGLQEEPDYPDPVTDAVVHLLRAEWLQRSGKPAEALEVLRWHEHSQISGHLSGVPQAGELAWALGTLARWKRHELLATLGTRDVEWCSVSRAIARLWADGEVVFQTRARQARQDAASPTCRQGP